MDSLIKLSEKQTSPATVKSSDFKVKTPAAGSGEEGMNQLVKQSTEQSSAGSVTGTSFKTEQNTGETGTSVSTSCSVNLGTGDHY